MSYAPKAAFYERYAPLAMEQQQKYGIPASITLAQMYIESGGGGSRLAREGNNYFGIKATSQWVAAGKPYSLHNDDRPNEKFCNYATVGDSIAHHSEFLMQPRYARCRVLESTDYKGWANGLKAAGYASASNYANDLIRDIEAYGLQKYDQMAVKTATRPIGYARGQTTEASATASCSVVPTVGYCFPLAGDNMVMSDGFGKSPTGYRDHVHKGIDLSAKNVPVFATENQGKVIATGRDASSGNFVKVEYSRADGGSWQVSYCHLDSINVKKDDIVNTGQQLGISGNTGNSTGPHLHLSCRKNGIVTDPLDYLAEISVRGGLQGTVLKKGSQQDLLAARKSSADATPTPADQWLLAQRQQNGQQQSAEHLTMNDAWLSKVGNMNDPMQMLAYMMSQGDASTMMGMGGGGLISSLVGMIFTAALSMSTRGTGGTEQAESKSAEESLTPEQERDAVIMRHRDTVDVTKARQLVSMNFDSESPEAEQGQGVRLS